MTAKIIRIKKKIEESNIKYPILTNTNKYTKYVILANIVQIHSSEKYQYNTMSQPDVRSNLSTRSKQNSNITQSQPIYVEHDSGPMRFYYGLA